MAFEDLFKIYPNKNMDIRAAAKSAYEYGATIAQEPSAAMSLGLNPHSMKRQRSYVTELTARVSAIHASPVPDMPYVHPTRFDIDLSKPYKQFTQDGLPLNEDTQLLAQYWMVCAVEMAASQSAGLAGSMVDADFERIINHLEVITKFLNEAEHRPPIDLPETAFPGAALTVPGAQQS